MIELIHKACGQVAFHYDGAPDPRKGPFHKHVTLLDGTKPNESDEPFCGSCSKPVQLQLGPADGLRVGGAVKIATG